ncbi:ABC transporter permease [Leptolyngbya sp. FACHB-711]|uniref:ABC transporter permease n=1 Tax=unclassified Leptolyngbya TaxID=2650499 RepID=UPI0016859C77|nr:ABC transporter permease [Leptolyngbya sp. FACHB-711]MBD1853227.1 ABC transporter permease [Cyanobacteria bacterium FACHB-502]MBD2028096.1 ABC transporter permease [Leptolyngbya sp. FACHB-711]
MLPLFFAELQRSWLQLRRYSSEVIGGIIGTTIIFYGLFLSAKYIAGPAFQLGDRLDSIVIGYVLWTLMLFIQGDIAGGLQQEARTGTLEQLFLTPYGASRLFFIRALASLLLNLGINLTILLLIIVITGSKLAFPLTLIPPLLAVLMGAYGLAFSIGSLALLLKQVQQLLSVFQFALLFLFTTPVETWTGSLRFVGWLLPMAPGAGLLRSVMARGEGLNWASLTIALLNGALYLTIGLTLFRWSERETKRRGKLGGY